MEILNIGKVARILFLFVECPVVKNYSVATCAQEVATRVHARNAKSSLNKIVIARFNQEKFNAGKRVKSILNVRQFVKRNEAVDNIYVIRYAASLGILLFSKIIHVK